MVVKMDEKGAHTLLVGLRHTAPQLTFTLHNLLEKETFDRNKVQRQTKH